MKRVRASKVIMIGIDGTIPEFIEKFAAEGIIPNMQRLMDQGMFSEVLSAPQADTPTNWTTIGTGAWPGTHGINSFGFHIEGEAYDQIYDMGKNLFPTVANASTEYYMNRLSKAEYIWQKAEKAGKKAILINWPGGWPPNVENAVVIDGTGPHSSPVCRMSNKAIFRAGSEVETSGSEVNMLPIREATGWKNMPLSQRPPLETCFDVTNQKSTETAEEVEQVQKKNSCILYWVLILANKGQTYDTVLICKSKDITETVARLKLGEESSWIPEQFSPTIGEMIYANMIFRKGFTATVKAKFKMSLGSLSPEGKSLTMERTPIFATQGWAYPSHVADELIEVVMEEEKQEVHQKKERELRSQKSPLCQVYESYSAMEEGLSSTCRYLTRKYDWDLLCIQMHAPDGINHDELNNLCPESPTYHEAKVQATWDKFRETYRILDRFVGNVVDAAADEDTLTLVISDHGGIPTKKRVALEVFLQKAGLVSFKKNERGRLVVDLLQSKVIPSINYVTHNIWVNLRGRDPNGFVAPEDYERVRTETISLLMGIADPETGEGPISLAIRKEHARDLGQWGDRLGDIVYFFKEGYSNKFTNCITGIDPNDLPEDGFEPVLEGPEFGRHHSFLPATTYCGCSVKGILIMSGPGVKKGYVRSFPLHTVDITPTVCFLAALPYPAQCQGMVPGDALEID